jgi:hypothetical protein
MMPTKDRKHLRPMLLVGDDANQGQETHTTDAVDM